MNKVIPLAHKRPAPAGPNPDPGVLPPGGVPPSGAAAASRTPEAPTALVLKRAVIENFKRLYPMPHVMVKARQIIADPNTDFEQLAGVLQADPALAGRIVKVANSAYYRRRGNIASVRQAAALLGMRVVGQIITLVSQSRMLGQALSGYGMEAGELWRHSLSVAILSELLSRQTRSADRSQAFLAGLMHDAGKIILNTYLDERSATAAASLSGADAVEAEIRALGFDHADIGGELCIKWQLPVVLANAIRFHHMPQLSVDNDLAYVLALADFMAHVDPSLEEEVDPWGPVTDILAYLDLSPDDAEKTFGMLDERLETLEEDTF